MRANWTVDSPREKNPTVSKNMEQVVLTAMHPDPSKRFQIAEDMADAIRGNYIGRGIPYVFCNGRKYPLEKTLRIGRSPDCDIFVKDPQLYVSEQHAEIYVKRSKFWIRDLRSTNGTFILQQGKFIRIKKTELRENVLIALCHDPRKGPYVTLSFSPNI